MKTSASTEWLLFHLWKKNPNTLESCPGIYCPDTVIYRWAKPYFWYFTNSKGQIIRKTKESIKMDEIYQKFSSSICPENVAASYLQCCERQEGQEEMVEFEHMEKEDLNFFLYRRDKHMNAILQKFMISKSNHNSVIKVNWSPQFYIINRRTNINKLNQNKIPLHERLCTFEGPEHLLMQDTALSPTISKDIEQLCQNIHRHIQDITGGLIIITRMVLYFKVDDENRLWLLFCSQVKTKNDLLDKTVLPGGIVQQSQQQQQGGKNRQKSPQFVMKQKFKTIQSELGTVQVQNGQVESLLNQFEKNCSNCEKLAVDLYGLQFQHIVESFQNGVYDNGMTVLPEKMKEIMDQGKNLNKKQSVRVFSDKTQKEQEQEQLRKFIEDEQKQMDYSFDNVPALITKVWGAIDSVKYKKLCQNESWLQYTTMVCDECYLLFTRVKIESEYVREMKEYQEKLRRPQEAEIDMFQEDKFDGNSQQDLQSYARSSQIVQMEKLQQEKDTQQAHVVQNFVCILIYSLFQLKEKAQSKAQISMKFVTKINRMGSRVGTVIQNMKQDNNKELLQGDQILSSGSKSGGTKRNTTIDGLPQIQKIQQTNKLSKNFVKETQEQLQKQKQNLKDMVQQQQQQQLQQNEVRVSTSQKKHRKQNSYGSQSSMVNVSTTNQSYSLSQNANAYRSKLMTQQQQRKTMEEQDNQKEMCKTQDQFYIRSGSPFTDNFQQENNDVVRASTSQNQKRVLMSRQQSSKYFFEKKYSKVPLQNNNRKQQQQQQKQFNNWTGMNSTKNSQEWFVEKVDKNKRMVMKGKNNKNLQMFNPNAIYKNMNNVKLPKQYMHKSFNSVNNNVSVSTQDNTLQYSSQYYHNNNSQQQQQNSNKNRGVNHGYMMQTIQNMKNVLQDLE